MKIKFEIARISFFGNFFTPKEYPRDIVRIKNSIIVSPTHGDQERIPDPRICFSKKIG